MCDIKFVPKPFFGKQHLKYWIFKHSSHGKARLSLCRPLRHVGDWMVQLHSFFTSTLERDKRSASCPNHFNMREQPPIHTKQVARWVQSWYGRFEMEKYLLHLLGIEPQFLSHPTHELVAILTTLFQHLIYFSI
jgi:hypothetical protein